MHREEAEAGDAPVKRSVALVIRGGARGDRVLAVRRPPDDESLPGVWGLPAGSLAPDESWADAVRRSGREKLDVEAEVGELLGEGRAARAGYTLHMRLYEARVVAGEPRVDRPGRDDVTRYVGWRWAEPAALEGAAARGSLCARLFLGS